MIDFTLTAEQKAFQKVVHDFAQNEIAPIAPQLDEEARHSPEVVEGYFNLGFLHYAVAEDYGGAGLGAFDGVLLSEELGAADSGMSSCLGGNTLGLMPFIIAGSPELKDELLTKHTSGPNLAAFCLTEAGAGSDVAAMRTTAVLEGDEYVLNGTKRFITNGNTASLYSVFAKEDPDLGHRGISAFMVHVDLQGVSAGKNENKMGNSSSPTSEVLI